MLEHVGQEILANGEAGGDLQRASGKWTQFVNRLPSQGGGAQQLLRVWAQGPARGRKRQLGPAALEQRNAQRLFQRLNARAYRRLADAQRFRGAMKAAKRRYCQKGFDLVQFHVLARGPAQYGRIMPLDKAFLSARREAHPAAMHKAGPAAGVAERERNTCGAGALARDLLVSASLGLYSGLPGH